MLKKIIKEEKQGGSPRGYSPKLRKIKDRKSLERGLYVFKKLLSKELDVHEPD